MQFMENEVKMINKVLENFDSFMASWKGKECKSRYNNFVCGKCVNGVVVKKFTNNKDLEWWQVGSKAYTVYRHKTDTNEVRPSIVNVSTSYKDDFAKAILKVCETLYFQNCASLKELAIKRKEKNKLKAQRKNNRSERIEWKKALDESDALWQWEINERFVTDKPQPKTPTLGKVLKQIENKYHGQYFTNKYFTYCNGDFMRTCDIESQIEASNESLTIQKNDGKKWHYNVTRQQAFEYLTDWYHRSAEWNCELGGIATEHQMDLDEYELSGFLYLA